MATELVPALILVASSVSSSGFDLSRKVLGRHLSPAPMVFLLAAASMPLFGLLLVLDGRAEIAPGYLAPALGSVLLNVAANLAFIQSVMIAPLSLTVPLLSLTPAFTALLGLLLLGERPAPLTVAGIVLVIAGAVWLNLVRCAPQAPPRTGSWRDRIFQPGIWLMAGTALLWSLSIPLDKLAVQRAGAPFHGLFLTAGIAVCSLAVLLFQGRLGELAGLRRAGVPFAFALASSTLALGLQLVALNLVLVSVVETVKRGIGNLMAVAMGWLIFGEGLSLRKLAAAALMAIGVALILL